MIKADSHFIHKQRDNSSLKLSDFSFPIRYLNGSMIKSFTYPGQYADKIAIFWIHQHCCAYQCLLIVVWKRIESMIMVCMLSALLLEWDSATDFEWPFWSLTPIAIDVVRSSAVIFHASVFSLLLIIDPIQDPLGGDKLLLRDDQK